jgi:hypothetical protein
MTVVRLLSLTLALVCAATLQAQPPQRENREERRRALLDGTHVLRRILHDHGFEPLDEAASLADAPERSLLVVLGNLDSLTQVRDALPGGLETFIRRGGAVLLASDRPPADDSLADELSAIASVAIGRESFHSPRNADAYHGLSYCPRLHPAPGAALPFFSVTGTGSDTSLKVFTNVPARLRQVRDFPGGVRPQATLADHSVFINQMMLPRDTGNVEFSYNVVRWLRGDGATRNRALFLEEGTLQTRFDIPLKSIDIPLEEALRLLFARRNDLLVEGNNTLVRLEEQDFFNQRLLAGLDAVRLPPQRLLVLALVGATVLGLLYLIYRLGVQARFRHEPGVQPLTRALSRTAPDDPLLDQRRQALLRMRNLNEPAGQLVRRWFQRLGVDPLAGMPRLTFRVGPWRRWWYSRQLRALWRLAIGHARGRVLPAQLWRLQRELDQLAAAFDRADWRFADHSSSLPAPRAEVLSR